MANKLTAIKIKQPDGDYSSQIPVGALAENISYNDTTLFSVKDVLGNVNMNKGDLQTQINNKIGPQEVESRVPTVVTDWLDTNIKPLNPGSVTDKTLTVLEAAADAKAAGDVIGDLRNIIDNISKTGKVIDFTTASIINGFINSSGDWSYTAANGQQSYIFNISNGLYTKLYVAARSGYTTGAGIGFLKNNNNLQNQQTPNYCTGYSGRINLEPGTTQEIEIPEDCNFITINKNYQSTNYTPTLTIFYLYKSIPEIDTSLTIQENAADAKVTGDKISFLESNLLSMTDVDFSEFTRQAGIIKSDGTWSDSSNYHSYFIPVDPENRYIQVRITAVGQQSQIAFLTSKTVSLDQRVPFCDGETERRIIKANTISDFILPSDCRYIWVFRDGKSILYTPAVMTFVASALTTEIIKRETDIVDLKNAIDNTLCTLEWSPSITKGSYYRFADGLIKDNNSYARTVALWNGYNTRVAFLMNSEIYEMAIFYYTADGSTTTTTIYLGHSNYEHNVVRFIPKNAEKIGISFRRIDQATLSDSDVTAISASLAVYAYTDTLLTQSGKVADAKIVGDNFIAVEDRLTADEEEIIRTANKIDEFQNSFNKIGIIENLAESTTWTENKYINATSSHADFGKMLTTSSLSATDFIQIPQSVQAIVYNQYISANVNAVLAGLCFYSDASVSSVISGIRSPYNASITGTSKLQYAVVPNGARYIRVCYWKDQTDSFGIYDAEKYFDSLQYNQILNNNLNVTKLLSEVILDATLLPTVYLNSSSIIKTSDNAGSYELENHNYRFLYIKSNTYGPATVTFCTGSIAELQANDQAPICAGTARQLINTNSAKMLFVPDDCTHIVILQKYSGVIRTPDGIVFLNEGLYSQMLDQIIKNVSTGGTRKDPVTAVIIGASIEAGTTHEWDNPSKAIIKQSKNYLRVALENNGIKVTNHSHGGMGFVRQASAGGYTAKSTVDGIVNTIVNEKEGFTQFDSCYICLGANDYSHDCPLGTPEDVTGAQTVCGQLRYCIETIYASNPTIKLFVKRMGGSGELNNAAIPYTQAELEIAMETICAEYGVEMITLGAIANSWTRRTIFPDGVHPTAEIMALMAKDATGRITFK